MADERVIPGLREQAMRNFMFAVYGGEVEIEACDIETCAKKIKAGDDIYKFAVEAEYQRLDLQAKLEEKELMLDIRSIEVGNLEKEADLLQAELQRLREENSELERKGKELCSVYGNSLIKIHDLEHDNAALKRPVSDEDQLNQIIAAIKTVNLHSPDTWLHCNRRGCAHLGDEAAMKIGIAVWDALTAFRSQEAQKGEDHD